MDPQIQGVAAPNTDLAVDSDIGLRHHRNEDSGAVSIGRDGGCILIVSDGISSASSAHLASALAVRAARDALCINGTLIEAESAVAGAITTAHAAVVRAGLPPEVGKAPPGATIVLALVFGRRITIGWLGDSRAFWLGDDASRQLTRDDSAVEELVESGKMTREQAEQSPYGHVITRCIGPIMLEDTAPPNVYQFDAPGTGWLLLCSDGLWNYFPTAKALRKLVPPATSSVTAEELARNLVGAAVAKGGHDNVTAAVFRVR